MFFLIFSILTKSKVKDYCYATPASFDALDSSYTLKYSYIIFRHGSRAPDYLFLPRDHRGGDWRCNEDSGQNPQIEAIPLNNPRRVRKVKDTEFIEYPPNCAKGELTVEGQQEEYDLGKSYREHYITQLKYLPDEFDPDVIEVRASHKDRTVRSTNSFLLGMYPVLYPNEYYHLKTGGEVIDYFDPSKDGCKDINNLYNNWTSTAEFKKLQEEVITNISDILEWVSVSRTNAENARNLNGVCDFITTLDCYDVGFPSTIPENAIETCKQWTGYMMYGLYEYGPAVCPSRAVRYMRQAIDQAINGETKYKMSITGCHDSTLLAYSTLLGHKNTKNPPYSSHIATEVYEKDKTLYIRVIFNNEVLKINGQELITYNEWKNILLPTDSFCTEDYTLESFVDA